MSVQYIADLEAPAAVERVEYVGPGRYSDEAKFSLVRHGRKITTFVASKSQMVKILSRRGKINITQKMISRV